MKMEFASNRISRSALERLAVSADELRVSMYVPMEHRFPESQENPARLRKAADQGEALLESRGVKSADARSLLSPARDLERDDEFWRQGGLNGLALLLSPSVGHCFRLPFACPESVDVGQAYYLTPLVRLLNWPVEFFVLSLSMNMVRLFRCTREAMHPVDLPPQTPASEAEYLAGTEVGRPIRFQTVVGATPTGGQITAVHGQTSYKDDAKFRRNEYVQVVARHVGQRLESQPLPLVLAAVNELHPVFQQAYTGPDLVEPGIRGSPDELSEVEIREQAVRLLEARHAGDVRAVCERYHHVAHSARSTNQLDQLVAAAIQGRVDSLIAGLGARVWGSWDSEARTVRFSGDGQTGRVDLVDLAVRETLRHAGHVCVVPRQEVPDEAVAAAILRW
jgi:hypothetical protein